MSDDQDPDVLSATMEDILAAARSAGATQAAPQTPFQIFKGAFSRTMGVLIGALCGVLVVMVVLILLQRMFGFLELLAMLMATS